MRLPKHSKTALVRKGELEFCVTKFMLTQKYQALPERKVRERLVTSNVKVENT